MKRLLAYLFIVVTLLACTQPAAQSSQATAAFSARRPRPPTLLPGDPDVVSSLVYKPGATTSGNVYGSVGGQQDPQLDIALSQNPGNVILQVDDSVVSPATIGPPSVPWRAAGINDITVIGLSDVNLATGTGEQVTITAPLPGVVRFSQLFVTYTGMAPFRALAANQADYFYLEHSALVAASSPIVDATAANSAASTLLVDSVLFDNAAWLATSSVTTFASVEAFDYSDVGQNTLSGPASTITVEVSAEATFNPTQPSVSGTITPAYPSAAQHNPDLPLLSVTQAAQPSAATGDLFGTPGVGIAFTSKTGHVRVHFDSSGGCDSTGRLVTATLAVDSPATISGIFESTGGADTGHTAEVDGEAFSTDVPVGALTHVRVLWDAGTGTYAPAAAGTLTIEDLL